MSMTITEKILAAHAGKSSVCPGELVQVQVDLALANDITAPLAIEVFHQLGASEVFECFLGGNDVVFSFLSGFRGCWWFLARLMMLLIVSWEASDVAVGFM